MGQFLTETECLEAFSSENYLVINKKLLSHYGPEIAVFLSNLIDKYLYFKKAEKLKDGIWFFLIHQNQMTQTGLTESKIRKCKRILSEQNIITTRMMGNPAKEWYQLHIKTLLSLINNRPKLLRGLETVRSSPKDSLGLSPKDLRGHIRRTNIRRTNIRNFNSSSNQNQNGFITLNQFEQFWELYPKKDGKGKALKSWTELCTQKTKQSIKPKWVQIEQAIQAQIKTERWQDKTYIPHPATWINQTRWIDDPKEMKSFGKDSSNSYYEDKEPDSKYTKQK